MYVHAVHALGIKPGTVLVNLVVFRTTVVRVYASGVGVDNVDDGGFDAMLMVVNDGIAGSNDGIAGSDDGDSEDGGLGGC